MRNEDILSEVDRRFSDLKDLLDAKFTHTNAEIQAGFFQAGKEREEIISHQRITNGRVTKLEDSTKFACWAQKNQKWIAAIVIILIFAVDFLTENVNVIEIIKLIK